MPGSHDTAAPALEFREVTSGYKHRTVLREVSFMIREGEFVCLIGPNGSGKSTLLKTAGALIKPKSGSVKVFGHDIAGLRPAKRASLIGVVPQKVESPMAFSVSQIVMNGRISARGRWGMYSTQDYDIAERAMIYTNVLELKERLFNELSGGEQQRVILAMALAQEPRIIMLDESISHLDINHRQEVLRILMNINREKRITVFLVSHDLNLSAQLSDRLLLMNHGELVMTGSPDEVLQPELLSRVYECELQVRKDPYTGHPIVSTVLENMVSRQPFHRRIHVIGGGGAGIELYRRLLLEGFELSSGVLNRLDSDAEAARALNISTVLEQPFSAVSRQAYEEARELVRLSDCVIVSRVPFGSGNLINLDLAADALGQGKPVWIAGDVGLRDYTKGREAERKAVLLCAAGAKTWENMKDLMAQLKQQKS
jgi:iron complex transport system ATP-binding protein